MFENFMELLLTNIELVVRLIFATVCGFMIGNERKNRNKEAGIRTHIIVALASCLMMEISKYGFADIGKADGARLAAQVVSGIGFLGAGMIFVHRNSIKGLTTAAGIWATSGIGMAIGAGMYFIGTFSAIMIVVLQIVLHKNPRFISHTSTETVTFIVDEVEGIIDYVCNLCKENCLACENISIKKIVDSQLRIEITVSMSEGFDMFEFTKKAISYPDIKSVYNDLHK